MAWISGKRSVAVHKERLRVALRSFSTRDSGRSTGRTQFIEKLTPNEAVLFDHCSLGKQDIVQLIRIADLRPRFCPDLSDGVRVQAAQVAERLDRERSSHGDGPGLDALRAGHRREMRMAQRSVTRGRMAMAPGCPGRCPTAPDSRFAKHRKQAIQVGSFIKTVLHSLLDERLIRHLDIADNVLLACRLRGKHGGE